jgi:hypothetical protein
MYYYFRRRGFARVRLPGEPWSEAIMEAHAAAMRGETPRPTLAIACAPSGSTAAVILSYYASPRAEAFHSIKSVSTRENHRRTLDRFAKDKWGALPFNRLDRLGIERVLADMKDTPGAARNFRNVLRRLCKWAIAEDLIAVDPTAGVKVTMPETDGFHTMTDAERAQYRSRHPDRHQGPRRICRAAFHRASRRRRGEAWPAARSSRSRRSARRPLPQTTENPRTRHPRRRARNA